MDDDALIVAGIAVAVILVALRLIDGARRPKQLKFRCSRCSAIATHTPRTIKASNRGKTKFFCRSCHAEWLRTHPEHAGQEPQGHAGCLSMMLLAILGPTVAVVALLSKY